MKKKNFIKTVLILCLLAVCCLPLTAQGTNIRGDVNDDGTLNISDVTALINYLLTDDASQINLANADLNADGFWNITDVTTLTDILLRCDTFTVNGVVFNMVPVKGGTFMMGAGDEINEVLGKEFERPAHQVTLTYNYRIGETEVTQELWVAVMGTNPSYFTPTNGYTENLQRPVERVTWTDCQEFIAKLNELTGKTFRLPTEAEWEFAARGGNLSHGYIYAGSDNPDDVMWYNENASTGVGTSSPDYGTHTVATKAPNELGLYDMSGNVDEWCQDWYGEYSEFPLVNPTGPETGTNYRIRRSGSWNWGYSACCVWSRGTLHWMYGLHTCGLRLVL